MAPGSASTGPTWCAWAPPAMSSGHASRPSLMPLSSSGWSAAPSSSRRPARGPRRRCRHPCRELGDRRGSPDRLRCWRRPGTIDPHPLARALRHRDRARRRPTYGLSPGDADHPEPYAYIYALDPARRPAHRADSFWNAVALHGRGAPVDQRRGRVGGFLQSRPREKRSCSGASRTTVAPYPTLSSEGHGLRPHEGRKDRLAEQRRKLPDGPGVYLFRDEKGKVIYVGKAKSIKKRVASTSPTRSRAARCR